MRTSVCCICLAAAGLSAAGRADEPPIVAKARAYLGPESVLNAVKSVHMLGSMVTSVENDPASQRSAKIEIIFQKPFQECLKEVTPELIMVKALDWYSGWQLTEKLNPGDPPAFNPKQPQQLTIMGPNEIRVLQADTWENLYYYRGIEAYGGTVEDQGPATIDGVACEKVEFTHPTKLVYDRYFDLATGRLVFTETFAHAKIRESEELTTGGIRFPKTITVEEMSGGKVQKTVITLDQVKLNEVFPESVFATPPPPLPIDVAISTGSASLPAPAPGPVRSVSPAAPAPGAAAPSSPPQP